MSHCIGWVEYELSYCEIRACYFVLYSLTKGVDWRQSMRDHKFRMPSS